MAWLQMPATTKRARHYGRLAADSSANTPPHDPGGGRGSAGPGGSAKYKAPQRATKRCDLMRAAAHLPCQTDRGCRGSLAGRITDPEISATYLLLVKPLPAPSMEGKRFDG